MKGKCFCGDIEKDNIRCDPECIINDPKPFLKGTIQMMWKPFLIVVFIMLTFLFLIGQVKANEFDTTWGLSNSGELQEGTSGGDLRRTATNLNFNNSYNVTQFIFKMSSKTGSPDNLVLELRETTVTGNLVWTSYLGSASINYTDAWNYISTGGVIFNNSNAYIFIMKCDACTNNNYYSSPANHTLNNNKNLLIYFYTGAWANFSYSIPLRVTYDVITSAGLKPSLNISWNLTNGTYLNVNTTSMKYNGTSVNNSEVYNCTYKYNGNNIITLEFPI